MLTTYRGRATDGLARFTGKRGAVDSRRSWFVELWVRGRYVGIAR